MTSLRPEPGPWMHMVSRRRRDTRLNGVCTMSNVYLVCLEKINDHDGRGRGFESRVSWFGARMQVNTMTRIDNGVDRAVVVPIN